MPKTDTKGKGGDKGTTAAAEANMVLELQARNNTRLYVYDMGKKFVTSESYVSEQPIPDIKEKFKKPDHSKASIRADFEGKGWKVLCG